MIYETRFLISLLLTLIIEMPLVLLLIKKIYKSKIKNTKILFVSFVASTITLPYLWFIFPAYIDSKFYIYLGEILVFIIETIIYNQLLNLKIKIALIISFIANLLSFLVGIILWNFLL